MVKGIGAIRTRRALRQFSIGADARRPAAWLTSFFKR